MPSSYCYLLNRLTSFYNGENTATYYYDADNMRNVKTVNGVNTKQVWVGADIALDITDGGMVKYTYGLDLIESDYGWYVYNANGDVVALADNIGNVTRNYEYDPYGVELGENNSQDVNPYRYNGQYTDLETGYIYLRARYYNPSTGCFINEDPAMDGYNWYIYCAGNPILYMDPSGNSYIGVNGEIYYEEGPSERYAKSLAEDNSLKVGNWAVDSTISGTKNSYTEGLRFGPFSTTKTSTLGFTEFMWRGQYNAKNSGSKGIVGAFEKVSLVNISKKHSVTYKNNEYAYKEVMDVGVIQGQQGLYYKDGSLGAGIGATASAASTRNTFCFKLFGWEVEVGGNADLLSYGAEAMIGYLPDKNGGRSFQTKAKVSKFGYGFGFVFRLKPPQ